MKLYIHNPNEVLDFWFKEISPKQRWEKSKDFDNLLATRFGALHAAAERCELFTWRDTAKGRLAEIIILDQWSRNIYRDTARSFSNDGLALGLAQMAVAIHADQDLDSQEKAFLYMPYMHSESSIIHAIAVKLYQQQGMESSLSFEHQHQHIIERFGRYPHRNAILGRISTPEELVFLSTAVNQHPKGTFPTAP